MKWSVFLKGLYIFFILAMAGLFYYGRAFYPAPSAKKVRLPLHSILRQSGSIGHLLGIVGTFFMILLLVYSMRKRLRFMRNWGNLNVWLEIHIFLGFSGPVLVLFHANFKFSGIVGLSAWAMILVVLSGIIGRYIYQLIPRSLSGMELGRIELEAEEIGLTFEVRKWLPREHPLWNILADIEKNVSRGTKLGVLFLLVDVIKWRIKLHGILKKAFALNPGQRRKLSKLILRRHLLIRRMEFLDSTMNVLYYWHLLHKPFVIIMFIILIIHVYVAMRMGYRWIL